jgi:hypothetical protein
VEVYDLVNDEYIYVCKGGAILSSLLPITGLDIALHFYLPVTAYDVRFEGPRGGEVHLRGVISTKDPIEGEYNKSACRCSTTYYALP